MPKKSAREKMRSDIYTAFAESFKKPDVLDRIVERKATEDACLDRTAKLLKQVKELIADPAFPEITNAEEAMELLKQLGQFKPPAQ